MPLPYRFMQLMNRLKRKPDHKGDAILALMLTYEIPAEGCGIDPNKTYHVTYMQDEITFHELKENKE